MMDKQIYDLTEDDINQHPAWYFPMDETVEDELTVRPVDDLHELGDVQIIVKTKFSDSQGNKYVGYIYWNTPSTVEDLKPILFTGNNECITFWNGIVKSTWSNYSPAQQSIKGCLPVQYKSYGLEHLHSLTGVLKGLYYYDDKDAINYTS